MSENKTFHDYVILKELNSDSIGKNYRAVEVKDHQPVKHVIITDVHPFLFQNPQEWNRCQVLMERIREADISSLYTPGHIIREAEQIRLIYPYIKGKSLDQILEDSRKKNQPVSFKMAFCIAVAIANLEEMGAAAVAGDKNAFHGFLTPDNVYIDYSGHITLKYFGLWPFFDENETASAEMIRKYGSWLPPEFIRREKIVHRSDLYHLGYMVYRMLTGSYFSYLPGEDFESTFTSISFTSDLPSTNIEFLTKLINFFKMSLNPDLKKRFTSIKEFKTYIVKNFNVESISDLPKSLADLMKAIYPEGCRQEEKTLEGELHKPLPEPVITQGKFLETVPEEISFDVIKKKSLRLPIIILSIIVAIVVIIATVLVISQTQEVKKQEEMAAQLRKEQDLEKQEFTKKLQEVRDKLQSLENRKDQDEQSTPISAEEKEARDREITRLKDREKELISKTQVQLPSKKITPPTKNEDKSISNSGTSSPKSLEKTTALKDDSQISRSTGDPHISTPPVTGPQTEKTTSAKTETAVEKTENLPAPVIPLHEVSQKPQKQSGAEPVFSDALQKTYAGRRATVEILLLITETGSVSQVKIMEAQKLPADVREVIEHTLLKWTYSPAQKDGKNVSTWVPEKLKIHFKYNF